MGNKVNLLIKDVCVQEEMAEIKNEENSLAKVHMKQTQPEPQLLILLKPMRGALVIPRLQTFFFTIGGTPKKRLRAYLSLESAQDFGKVLLHTQKVNRMTSGHVFFFQSTKDEISKYTSRFKTLRLIPTGLKRHTRRQRLRRFGTWASLDSIDVPEQ